jgi:CheY-like chemotaxis protein
MRRVLVLEPYEGIRAVIESVVRLLGHEPVAVTAGASLAEVGPVHAAVIEPAAPAAPKLLQELLDADPQFPIIYVSIVAGGEPEMLAVEPVAYLVKPFAVSDLSAALERALGSADD